MSIVAFKTQLSAIDTCYLKREKGNPSVSLRFPFFQNFGTDLPPCFQEICSSNNTEISSIVDAVHELSRSCCPHQISRILGFLNFIYVQSNSYIEKQSQDEHISVSARQKLSEFIEKLETSVTTDMTIGGASQGASSVEITVGTVPEGTRSPSVLLSCCEALVRRFTAQVLPAAHAAVQLHKMEHPANQATDSGAQISSPIDDFLSIPLFTSSDLNPATLDAHIFGFQQFLEEIFSTLSLRIENSPRSVSLLRVSEFLVEKFGELREHVKNEIEKMVQVWSEEPLKEESEQLVEKSQEDAFTTESSKLGKSSDSHHIAKSEILERSSTPTDSQPLKTEIFQPPFAVAPPEAPVTVDDLMEDLMEDTLEFDLPDPATASPLQLPPPPIAAIGENSKKSEIPHQDQILIISGDQSQPDDLDLNQQMGDEDFFDGMESDHLSTPVKEEKTFGQMTNSPRSESNVKGSADERSARRTLDLDSKTNSATRREDESRHSTARSPVGRRNQYNSSKKENYFKSYDRESDRYGKNASGNGYKKEKEKTYDRYKRERSSRDSSKERGRSRSRSPSQKRRTFYPSRLDNRSQQQQPQQQQKESTSEGKVDWSKLRSIHTVVAASKIQSESSPTDSPMPPPSQSPSVPFPSPLPQLATQPLVLETPSQTEGNVALDQKLPAQSESRQRLSAPSLSEEEEEGAITEESESDRSQSPPTTKPRMVVRGRYIPQRSLYSDREDNRLQLEQEERARERKIMKKRKAVGSAASSAAAAAQKPISTVDQPPPAPAGQEIAALAAVLNREKVPIRTKEDRKCAMEKLRQMERKAARPNLAVDRGAAFDVASIDEPGFQVSEHETLSYCFIPTGWGDPLPFLECLNKLKNLRTMVYRDWDNATVAVLVFRKFKKGSRTAFTPPPTVSCNGKFMIIRRGRALFFLWLLNHLGLTFSKAHLSLVAPRSFGNGVARQEDFIPAGDFEKVNRELALSFPGISRFCSATHAPKINCILDLVDGPEFRDRFSFDEKNREFHPVRWLRKEERREERGWKDGCFCNVLDSMSEQLVNDLGLRVPPRPKHKQNCCVLDEVFGRWESS